MSYDPISDIKKVKEYYEQDPLQKRFSALIAGETGVGKSFLLRTCRFPMHIDSFDPGGTKCLRKWIERGDIVADTRWENEDPYEPTVFEAWKKETDYRFKVGYFDYFATYALDSLTTFSDAVMNAQLNKNSRAGEAPKFTKDYTPQKTDVVNRITKFMKLSCDFILTAHLKDMPEQKGTDKEGNPIMTSKYRLLVTGQAVVTVPMKFDELYILIGKDSPGGLARKLITDSQGQYIARSRLRADGKLDKEEEADMRALLKKIGLKWEDKPKLNLAT
jgi:hypothetical protein